MEVTPHSNEKKTNHRKIPKRQKTGGWTVSHVTIAGRVRSTHGGNINDASELVNLMCVWFFFKSEAIQDLKYSFFLFKHTFTLE